MCRGMDVDRKAMKRAGASKTRKRMASEMDAAWKRMEMGIAHGKGKGRREEEKEGRRSLHRDKESGGMRNYYRGEENGGESVRL